MNRFISLLGLAYKARKVSVGFDAVHESIKKKYAKLIIATCDISKKSLRKIESKADDVNILQVKESMMDLSVIFSKQVSLVAVNDEGFAKKLIELEAITYYDKI